MAGEYRLGIDLGTTFTAAAMARDGRVEAVPLGGSNGIAVPSVMHLAPDGQLHFGADAVRRSGTEPERVVREFKRRVGDPTPYVLGDETVGAEALMAALASWVVDRVAATEGSVRPEAIAVTHPANWGEHKRSLLRGALSSAGVPADRLVAEPVAAAHYYAAQRRLTPGTVVAVYDLGGGTFDSAVVAVTEGNCIIRGRPEGIERLGGIDFDEAVFGHVMRALELDPTGLDAGDPSWVAAVTKLRRSCVDAKEALSDASSVMVPVMLPDRHTQVQLTRTELEAMIRPALDETIVALRRAIDSASVTVADLSAVLLVGGSSRLPLVEQLIASELGRPVATDARPKDAISMGAAFLLSTMDQAHSGPVTAIPPVPVPPSAHAATAPEPQPAPPAADLRPVPPASGSTPVVGADPRPAPPGGMDSGGNRPPPPISGSTPAVGSDPRPAPPLHTGPVPAVGGGGGGGGGKSRRLVVLAAAAAIAVLVVAVGVLSGGDDGDSESANPSGQPPAEDGGKDTKPGDSGSVGADEPDPDLAIAGQFDLTGLEVKVDAPAVTERALLAYMTVLALEEAGADAEAIVETTSIGPRERRDQLLAGDIDLFWDAVGSPGGDIAADLPDNVSAEELQAALVEMDKPNGLTWLEPVNYSADSTVAMRRAESERLGITSLEDLPALAESDRGATTICFTTEPQVEQMEEDYAFEFFDRTFVPDPFVTYDEVADGSCTFAIVPYGVRPSMAELDLVALDDPDSTFVNSHVAPRLRLADYEDHPEIGNVLGPIARNIDGATMAELVARVEIGGEDPAAVALDHLVTQGFLTP